MKSYIFRGNPDDYRWDFPLTPDQTYQGSTQPFHRHTIEELIESARKEGDNKFLKEWEEVHNG